jgi:hypothetical protein
MAKYSAFAEKAGMRKIAQQQIVEGISSVSKALSELGFDPHLLGSERYVMAKLESLQPEQIKEIKAAFIRNSHTRFRREFAASRHQPFGKVADYVNSVNRAELPELGKLVKLVGMISQTKVYLLWVNLEKYEKEE